jgi:hypothetical protein
MKQLLGAWCMPCADVPKDFKKMMFQRKVIFLKSGGKQSFQIMKNFFIFQFCKVI